MTSGVSGPHSTINIFFFNGGAVYIYIRLYFSHFFVNDHSSSVFSNFIIKLGKKTGGTTLMVLGCDHVTMTARYKMLRTTVTLLFFVFLLFIPHIE